jgi:predicted TIM-barrel fold metal-dependent hydrolase
MRGCVEAGFTSFQGLLCGIDGAHTPHGEPLPGPFMTVSNEFVLRMCNENRPFLVPAISVHPYRKDALAELERWAKMGVRAVHWHPALMQFDPSDYRCLPLYRKMVVWDMVLFTHTGASLTSSPEMGNPLRLRPALDCGVTVVAVHCGTRGKVRDLEHPVEPLVEAFEVFQRMLRDTRYAGKLFGEISSVASRNRAHHLDALLGEADGDCKFVYGSGSPRPAMPYFTRTKELRSRGLLEKSVVPLLEEILRINPLLYDVVSKRLATSHLGKSFQDRTFSNLFNLGWPPGNAVQALQQRDAASILALSRVERRSRAESEGKKPRRNVSAGGTSHSTHSKRRSKSAGGGGGAARGADGKGKRPASPPSPGGHPHQPSSAHQGSRPPHIKVTPLRASSSQNHSDRRLSGLPGHLNDIEDQAAMSGTPTRGANTSLWSSPSRGLSGKDKEKGAGASRGESHSEVDPLLESSNPAAQQGGGSRPRQTNHHHNKTPTDSDEES